MSKIQILYLISIMHIIINNIAGIFIYLFIREKYGPKNAAIAYCFWILSSIIVNTALMGTETSLLVMFTSIVMYLTTKNLKGWNMVYFWVASGLMVLSRLDGTLILSGIWLYMLLTKYKIKVAAIVKSALGAIVAIVFWLSISYEKTGTFVPQSSKALKLLRFARYDYWTLIMHSIGQFFNYVAKMFIPIDAKIAFAFLGILITLILVKIRGKNILYNIGLYILLFWAPFYMFFQLGFRGWYSLVIYLAFVCMIFGTEVKNAKKYFIVVCAVAALIFAQAFAIGPNFPQEGVKYTLTKEANEIIPEDAIVGSFNTGVYNYFIKNEVINLDGVVNPEAIAHNKNGTIDEYIIKKKISYVIDTESYLDKLESDKIELRKIATISSNVTEEYHITKVEVIAR
jgi:hypothetical protein